MTKWLTIIASILAEIIIKLFKQSGPVHIEGKSDGNTEKKLRDKAKKDGWNV